MALTHKDVGEDLPAGILSSWSGHITSEQSLEHTDSDKVDSARMHVREQHAPGLAELAGLERALFTRQSIVIWSMRRVQEDRFGGLRHGR